VPGARGLDLTVQARLTASVADVEIKTLPCGSRACGRSRRM